MRVVFLFLALLFCAACPSSGGPCQFHDSLFGTPTAESRLEADGGLRVDVRWTPDTTIPAAFYQSPMVDFPSGEERSRRAFVRLQDAGLEGATVAFSNEIVGSSAAFSLRYVEGVARTCKHVGMDDTYVLSVSVPVAADGGVQPGTVKASTELGAL